jgi:hypothetical protein
MSNKQWDIEVRQVKGLEYKGEVRYRVICTQVNGPGRMVMGDTTAEHAENARQYWQAKLNRPDDGR